MGKQISEIPAPSVMPGDRQKWLAELPLSTFVNAFYQHRDLGRLGKVKSVLMVGPGQGLASEVLKWRGYQVTTLDIDESFRPDVTGSVHDMRVFPDKAFDAVIASHVLEHMAEPYLDPALKEIARVGSYALIYLPVHGLHLQLRFRSNFRDLDFSLIGDLFNYFARPVGLMPRYMDGQHYWEIGMRGFRKRDIVRRLSEYFDILDVYRNRDWLPSQNFVLRAR